MKKLLITTNVITLLFLGLTYFSGCKKTSDTASDISSDHTCTPCSGQVPYQQVSSDYITNLITNYRDNHFALINSSPDFKGTLVDMTGMKYDSRSVWFDLNKLKSFIADIETKTDSKCKDGHCAHNLGIRIYFGEYGGKAIGASSDYNYEGLHTLVMVPTIQDATQVGTVNENVDFDPEHMTNCTPDSISSSWQFFTALVPDADITAMNHGTLIPPPDRICTGAKFMHFIDGLSCP